MSHFFLPPPRPGKYASSSCVGISPSPWSSHSLSKARPGSSSKSCQHSSWLWQNTKTEPLKFYHSGFLVHIGNLLFLMQTLSIFHEKPDVGMGRHKKELMTKPKTSTDMRLYQQLRGTETTLRQMESESVCVHTGRTVGRWIPPYQLCLLRGSTQKTSSQSTHMSWGAVRWIHYWPYSPPNQLGGVGRDTVVAERMQEKVTSEKSLGRNACWEAYFRSLHFIYYI